MSCGNTEQNPKDDSNNTWTYTYLKAKPGQKENLKSFLEANWLKMDSVAISRGLFNDYELLVNADNNETAAWDFIVAVEYYTPTTYADISDEWELIQEEHQTVLIDGLSFKDLGSYLKTDTLFKED